jgi:hypothetical protein
MNSMFVFVVCFGTVFLGVAIASIIFNASAARSSRPAPWMRRVRQFQDEKENAGWRIQMIPYGDTSKPMTVNVSGLLGIVPILGALGFISGLAVATYDRKYESSGLMVAVPSIAVALCGCWLKARYQVQGWDVAPGRCVDRELRKVWLSTGMGSSGGGWGWIWRIVCQYEYLGIPYRVTPEVYWASFGSEQAALKFLEARIGSNGECMLRVNPKNPLQTELLG